jgi:hypothetical protein
MIGYWFDARGSPLPGLGYFLLTITDFTPTQGFTLHPIHWVPEAVPGNKEPERETNHIPSYSAEVKNAWRHTSVLPYIFMLWDFKIRGNFSYLIIQ